MSDNVYTGNNAIGLPILIPQIAKSLPRFDKYYKLNDYLKILYKENTLPSSHIGELVDMVYFRTIEDITKQFNVFLHISKDLRVVRCTGRDAGDREHVMELNYIKKDIFSVISSSLPDGVLSPASKKPLKVIVKLFVEQLERLMKYFDELEGLDSIYNVVEPRSPTFKTGFRKIALADKIWLGLYVTLEGKPTSVFLIGKPDEYWNTRYNIGIQNWDEEQSIAENIRIMFSSNDNPPFYEEASPPASSGPPFYRSDSQLSDNSVSEEQELSDITSVPESERWKIPEPIFRPGSPLPEVHLRIATPLPDPSEPGPSSDPYLPGPSQPGPSSDPDLPGPSQPGPSQPGPSQSGPSQPGPSQPGPSQPGPSRTERPATLQIPKPEPQVASPKSGSESPKPSKIPVKSPTGSPSRSDKERSPESQRGLTKIPIKRQRLDSKTESEPGKSTGAKPKKKSGKGRRGSKPEQSAEKAGPSKAETSASSSKPAEQTTEKPGSSDKTKSSEEITGPSGDKAKPTEKPASSSEKSKKETAGSSAPGPEIDSPDVCARFRSHMTARDDKKEKTAALSKPDPLEQESSSFRARSSRMSVERTTSEEESTEPFRRRSSRVQLEKSPIKPVTPGTEPSVEKIEPKKKEEKVESKEEVGPEPYRTRSSRVKLEKSPIKTVTQETKPEQIEPKKDVEKPVEPEKSESQAPSVTKKPKIDPSATKKGESEPKKVEDTSESDEPVRPERRRRSSKAKTEAPTVPSKPDKSTPATEKTSTEAEKPTKKATTDLEKQAEEDIDRPESPPPFRSRTSSVRLEKPTKKPEKTEVSTEKPSETERPESPPPFRTRTSSVRLEKPTKKPEKPETQPKPSTSKEADRPGTPIPSKEEAQKPEKPVSSPQRPERPQTPRPGTPVPEKGEAWPDRPGTPTPTMSPPPFTNKKAAGPKVDLTDVPDVFDSPPQHFRERTSAVYLKKSPTGGVHVKSDPKSPKSPKSPNLTPLDINTPLPLSPTSIRDPSFKSPTTVAPRMKRRSDDVARLLDLPDMDQKYKIQCIYAGSKPKIRRLIPLPPALFKTERRFSLICDIYGAYEPEYGQPVYGGDDEDTVQTPTDPGRVLSLTPPEDVCSICLGAGEFEGSVPTPLCANPHCHTYQHEYCLREWLKTTGVTLAIGVITGNCSDCANPISISNKNK